MHSHLKVGCPARATPAQTSSHRPRQYSSAHNRSQHLLLRLLSRKCNNKRCTCRLHQPNLCHHRRRCRKSLRYERCHKTLFRRIRAFNINLEDLSDRPRGSWNLTLYKQRPKCHFRRRYSASELLSSTLLVLFDMLTFYSSHFNTAHFMNPDFQPEEWHPGDDYVVTTASGKSARHRNSG